MKKKINSLTAGGQTRPEILPGDIFKDNRGERVTVKMVTDNRITYIRHGYSGECVFPVERFEREFRPVNARRSANGASRTIQQKKFITCGL